MYSVLSEVARAWVDSQPRNPALFFRMRRLGREKALPLSWESHAIVGCFLALMLSPFDELEDTGQVLWFWMMLVAVGTLTGHVLLQSGLSPGYLWSFGLVCLALHAGVALFRALVQTGDEALESLVFHHSDRVEDLAHEALALSEQAHLESRIGTAGVRGGSRSVPRRL